MFLVVSFTLTKPLTCAHIFTHTAPLSHGVSHSLLFFLFYLYSHTDFQHLGSPTLSLSCHSRLGYAVFHSLLCGDKSLSQACIIQIQSHASNGFLYIIFMQFVTVCYNASHRHFTTTLSLTHTHTHTSHNICPLCVPIVTDTQLHRCSHIH